LDLRTLARNVALMLCGVEAILHACNHQSTR
jgi:hypothetical protein